MNARSSPIPVPIGPVAAASHIVLGDGGDPHILAHRCADCSAIFTRVHMRCPRCSSARPPVAFRASERGVVTGYSVVMRSYPGVKVPFISAVVELDDGVVLKAVLRDLAPEPVALGARLPVRVVFGEVAEQKDEAGNPYIAYHFVPEKT